MMPGDKGNCDGRASGRHRATRVDRHHGDYRRHCHNRQRYHGIRNSGQKREHGGDRNTEINRIRQGTLNARPYNLKQGGRHES